MNHKKFAARKQGYLLLGGLLMILIGSFALFQLFFFRNTDAIHAAGKRFQVDAGGTLMNGLGSYLKMEDASAFWGPMSFYATESPIFASGKIGNALTGAGYLQVSPGNPFAFENTEPFSLAIWVQHSSADGGSIADKLVNSVGWNFYLADNKYVLLLSSFEGGHIKVETQNIFSDGLWHLVAFTYDGSSRASGIHIYVDNVDQALSVVSDTLNGSIVTAMDGHIKTGVDKVDEMGTWNRVLMPQEVSDLWNGGNGQTMVERPDLIPVSIDIRPDNKENVINLGSGGTVSVAIFGSGDLDVRQIDLASVIFAGAPIEGRVNEKTDYRDINKDGFADMAVNISIEKLKLTLSDTSAELEGFLMDGTGIKGSDMVRVVPR